MSHVRRRVTRGIVLVASAFAMAALAGCGSTYRSRLEVPIGGVAAAGDSAPAEGTTITIPAPSGEMAVDVENNKGGVTIRVDPRADRITVVGDVWVSSDVDDDHRQALADSVTLWANLEAGDSGGADHDEGMDAAGATAGAGADSRPHGSVLRVRAESPDPAAGDHSVHLVITMPRCDGVRVNSRGGDVLLRGTAGAVQVENRGGAIEMKTDRAVDAPIMLTTDTGNIYFQAPSESSGRFELRSLEGEVTFSTTRAPKQVYARSDIYRGVLNNGVNPVVLQSDRGDVHAWVRDDAMQFGRLFK